MGRTPHKDEGSDLNNASTSQGTPQILDSQENIGKKHGTDSPSKPPEGTNASDTWISEFWPLEL